MLRSAILISVFALAACTGRIDSPLVPLAPPTPIPEVVVPPQPEVCDLPNPLPSAPVPMRRLNTSHVELAVQDALGVSEKLSVSDERLFTFRSNISSPVDNSAVAAYFDFAEKVVDKVSLSPCTTAAVCKAWVVDDLGRKLFRRPLDGALRDRYLALFDKGVLKDGTAKDGAKWVLQAMLQSPAFLYLDEPTGTDGYLDGYAMAARLAQTFWSSNPDAALLDAAKNGQLDTADGVRARAAAMLVDPRSAHGFEAFVSQWLDLERLRQTDARPDLVALGPATLAALEQEPLEVFRLAIADRGSFSSLFTNPRTVPLPALTALYGTDIVSTVDGVTHLDPTRRAGLLTLPGVMASLSHAGATSPTLRGYAILANLMCTPPPPPPAGVNVTLPMTDPNATTRERLEAHFSAATCASCHKSMDGLGFAFERFDPTGATRALDKGRAIDDRSTFELGGQSFSVTGALELSAVLGQRKEVTECFAKQWSRYAAGIPEKPAARCFVKSLATNLNLKGGMSQMMVELAASDYLRKGAAP